IRDEGAPAGGAGVLGAGAVAGLGLDLPAVEEVHARRVARAHLERVLDPAIREVAAVERRDDLGVLGVGTEGVTDGVLVIEGDAVEVVRFVVAPGEEAEPVRDVRASGIGGIAAVVPEEVHVGLFPAPGHRHRHLDAVRAPHAGWRRRVGRRACPGVLRHEDDLVVLVHERVAVAPDVGALVHVNGDIDGPALEAPVRRLAADVVAAVVGPREVDLLALVHLHRDGDPRAVLVAERRDVLGRGPPQRLERLARNDDGLGGAGVRERLRGPPAPEGSYQHEGEWDEVAHGRRLLCYGVLYGSIFSATRAVPRIGPPWNIANCGPGFAAPPG